MTDERLLSIIHEAPLPFGKTDSQLAQEYRNWFYGVRSERLRADEKREQAIKSDSPGSVESK